MTVNKDIYFESPIFGTARLPTEEEIEQLRQLVTQVPVAMFQELNRRLNGRGFCMSIATLEERQ